MVSSLIASIIAFVSTNLDDLLILMLLYAQTKIPAEDRKITIGHTLGIGLLALISLVAAFGTRLLPVQYIRYLGLIPILLGFHAMWEHCKSSKDDLPEGSNSLGRIGIVNTAIITIANGADNIGVYIPLFADFDGVQLLSAFAVFFLMNLLWCSFGQKIADLPMIQNMVSKYKSLAMGLVFSAIGFYVLLK